MGTVFAVSMLSHCLAKVGRYAQSTEGTLLYCLALVTKGTCVPGSHHSVTIRDSFWQATTPRALQRQQVETHSQSFCEKSCLPVLQLQPVGQASDLPHI